MSAYPHPVWRPYSSKIVGTVTRLHARRRKNAPGMPVACSSAGVAP